MSKGRLVKVYGNKFKVTLEEEHNIMHIRPIDDYLPAKAEACYAEIKAEIKGFRGTCFDGPGDMSALCDACFHDDLHSAVRATCRNLAYLIDKLQKQEWREREIKTFVRTKIPINFS